jgi:hypothetical protein
MTGVGWMVLLLYYFDFLNLLAGHHYSIDWRISFSLNLSSSLPFAPINHVYLKLAFQPLFTMFSSPRLRPLCE